MSLLDYGDLRQKTPDRVWLEIGMARYAELCREGRIVAARIQHCAETDAEVNDIVQRVQLLVRQARLVIKVLDDMESKLLLADTVWFDRLKGEEF